MNCTIEHINAMLSNDYNNSLNWILNHLKDRPEDDLLVVNEDGDIFLKCKVGDNIVSQRKAILGRSYVYAYERVELKDKCSHMITIGNN